MNPIEQWKHRTLLWILIGIAAIINGIPELRYANAYSARKASSSMSVVISSQKMAPLVIPAASEVPIKPDEPINNPQPILPALAKEADNTEGDNSEPSVFFSTMPLQASAPSMPRNSDPQEDRQEVPQFSYLGKAKAEIASTPTTSSTDSSAAALASSASAELQPIPQPTNQLAANALTTGAKTKFKKSSLGGKVSPMQAAMQEKFNQPDSASPTQSHSPKKSANASSSASTAKSSPQNKRQYNPANPSSTRQQSTYKPVKPVPYHPPPKSKPQQSNNRRK